MAGWRCRRSRAASPTCSISTSTTAWCATSWSRTRYARPTRTCCSTAGIRPTCCSWKSIRPRSMSTRIRPSTRYVFATAAWCMTSCFAPCTRRWHRYGRRPISRCRSRRSRSRRCRWTAHMARRPPQSGLRFDVREQIGRYAALHPVAPQTAAASPASHSRCRRGRFSARLRAGTVARCLHPGAERGRAGRWWICTPPTSASPTNS